MNRTLKEYCRCKYDYVKKYLQKHKKSIFSGLFVIISVCIIAIPDILGLMLYGHLPNFVAPYIQTLRIYLFLTAPAFFLPGIFGKLYFYVEIIILTFTAMASLILLHMFNLPISGDCYMLIFNTHLQEATEFTMTLLRWENVLITVMCTAFAASCIFFMRKLQWKFSVLNILLGIILLMPLSITLLRYHHKKRNITLAVERGSFGKFAVQYFVFKERFEKNMKDLTKTPLLPAPHIKKRNDSTTGIIVIGESAWRKHLGIYGYSRNTTPNLLKRKDSILAWNNVISADIQTPTSIRFFLTDAVLERPDTVDYTLIDLFNHAGYKTHWVSNQPAWGLGGYESATTFLALKCHSLFYLHKNAPSQKYDEALIKPVEKLLDSEEPQIIFVHLQGSHIDYAGRYPESFGSFTGCNDKVYQSINSARNRKITNEYDNSIEYTDHVLEQLISLLEKRKPVSFMLYFSDHGECADIDNSAARRSAVSKNKACYEIPFLMWYSPEYGIKNQQMLRAGKKNLNSSLQGDKALWTLCDAAGIYWEGFPENKSLFSAEYIPPVKRFFVDKSVY